MATLSTLIAYLLPLAALVAIYTLIAKRTGFTFHPRKAQLAARSTRGPLVAVWLALLAATWTLIDLAAELQPDAAAQPATASLVVTIIGIATLGLVVAERTTIFVLSLLGIAAQIVGIAREYGLTAAVSALAAAAAATWLFGLGRGLLDRR